MNIYAVTDEHCRYNVFNKYIFAAKPINMIQYV